MVTHCACGQVVCEGKVVAYNSQRVITMFVLLPGSNINVVTIKDTHETLICNHVDNGYYGRNLHKAFYRTHTGPLKADYKSWRCPVLLTGRVYCTHTSDKPFCPEIH